MPTRSGIAQSKPIFPESRRRLLHGKLPPVNSNWAWFESGHIPTSHIAEAAA
jgi:hypothetical protein